MERGQEGLLKDALCQTLRTLRGLGEILPQVPPGLETGELCCSLTEAETRKGTDAGALIAASNLRFQELG